MHDNVHDILLGVTVLMLGAATLVWLLQRLRLSPILAYLALGILAGPYQSLLFPEENGAQALAELGVVLLMFFIGLEFHLEQLRAMLKLCLGGGALQVGLTAIAAGFIAHLFGLGHISAAVIGVMVAFSSTALVMKVFQDRREADSHRARVFLAVGLLQDLAAILAVVALPLVASVWPQEGASTKDAVGASAALQRFGILFILLPIIFFFARRVLPKIFENVARARDPEAFTLISLSAALCVGFAAFAAGASLPLGAFLGGLVLSRTPFTSQIMAELNTFRNLSLGFFFVSIGALVDMNYVLAHGWQLLAGVVAVIVFKTLIAFGSLLIVRTPIAIAAGVALPLSQIGEFSFVLGQQALHAGMLSDAQHRFIIALAVLSLIPAPFLTAASGSFGDKVSDIFSKIFGARITAWLNPQLNLPPAEHAPPKPAPGAAPAETPSPESKPPAKARAVVVGYGPVGRTLTRILTDFGIQPTIIDMNIETVRKLKERGIDAVYGDAGRREILIAAQTETAAYLLVTLPDLTSRIPVVATARMINPNLKTFVRARYLAERAMLEDAGATAVAYEEAEVAVSLAHLMLREIGARDEDIEREAARIRAEIALRTGFTAVMPAIRIKKKS